MWKYFSFDNLDAQTLPNYYRKKNNLFFLFVLYINLNLVTIYIYLAYFLCFYNPIKK